MSVKLVVEFSRTIYPENLPFVMSTSRHVLRRALLFFPRTRSNGYLWLRGLREPRLRSRPKKRRTINTQTSVRTAVTGLGSFIVSSNACACVTAAALAHTCPHARTPPWRTCCSRRVHVSVLSAYDSNYVARTRVVNTASSTCAKVITDVANSTRSAPVGHLGANLNTTY